VGIPEPGDPAKITITLPAGTSIPADNSGSIKIVHTGKYELWQKKPTLSVASLTG
jgi:hypothetical protein